MEPTKEWLEQWNAQREKLRCIEDFNTYFENSDPEGDSVIINIGTCSVPTGKLLVRDPLYYLRERQEQPYFLTCPTGEYPVELCVVKDEEGKYVRYAAARMRFTDRAAVWFEHALTGTENIENIEEEWDFLGFCVDGGLACICDEEIHQIFCDFVEKWFQEHPNGNLYNDYFDEFFLKSYDEHPEYQRNGGDWINWNIPGTDYHLPIFQSGYGDGFYPVLWGMDEYGEVCQIMVVFMEEEDIEEE